TVVITGTSAPAATTLQPHGLAAQRKRRPPPGPAITARRPRLYATLAATTASAVTPVTGEFTRPISGHYGTPRRPLPVSAAVIRRRAPGAAPAVGRAGAIPRRPEAVPQSAVASGY